MLPGAPAPKGLLGSASFCYFSIAGGVVLLGTSMYLLVPGVAKRYDLKIALEMAKPAADRARKLRKIALALAAAIIAEIPIAVLSWPSDEERTWALTAIGTTLLVLIATIGGQIQLSRRETS